MSRWSRAFILAAGWAFVGLAVLGVFVPVLPTTPFVLLASSCFIRSSPRARRWLAENRWFGPMLREWEEHRAIRRSVKVLAIVTVLAVIALAMVRDLHWTRRVPVVVLGVVGLAVVLRLRTIPRAAPTDARPKTRPARSPPP